ncbi:S1 RNA-binding domain-containing protein [Paenibacillus sp. P25]|nr:S1 RNA-binding domain-containing protein [Paenibacillus sp. P25]
MTSFGMFVELDNTVEGLIRLSDLTDDYYHFHEAQHALIGERTSKIYRLGDEVKVRVARVSMEEHTIDFEMVDMKPRQQKVSLVDALNAVRKGKRTGGRGERSAAAGGRAGRGERTGKRGGGAASSGRGKGPAAAKTRALESVRSGESAKGRGKGAAAAEDAGARSRAQRRGRRLGAARALRRPRSGASGS